MKRFIVVDMRSGMMDGMYFDFEFAKGMAEFMERRYEGSYCIVCEMDEHSLDFPGNFPPDHLMHWNMKKHFYKDKEWVQERES